MAYLSLYRRYRPQTFADIVGQEHVTRTLVNALSEGRLHHAYLFTGPRGTGKTSTARILAKAINCADGPTATPCNTCDRCVEITDGSSVDVIELDMASHGGVDDARELRDRAQFSPARSRRKVYILDEVHMASTAAFNALLKLVEEPPAHVLFAMATTDPQKVLPTILSRVQRLDLRRVPAATVADQVRRICGAEGFSIDDDALDAIVRAGDGSVRDTLSVLEQVLAFSGADVTADAVARVLGVIPQDRTFDVLDRVRAGDVAGVLVAVQGLVDDGHDLRRFSLDLAGHVRDVLACRVAPDRPDLLSATDERRERLAIQAEAFTQDELVRIVRALAATATEQRQHSPRLPLEIALSGLAVELGTNALVAPAPVSADSNPTPAPASGDVEPATVSPPSPAPETSGDSVVDPAPAASDADVADVADQADSAAANDDVDPAAGATAEPTRASSGPAPAHPPAESQEADLTMADAPAAASGDELARVREHWDDILDTVKQQSRRAHAIFEPATPVRAGRGILTLRYARRYASFHAANANRGEFAELLRASLKARCGIAAKLEIVIEGDDDRRRPQPPSVTPDDARTPVLDAQAASSAAASSDDERDSGQTSGDTQPDASQSAESTSDPDGDEEVDVREAELSAGPQEADVDSLLADELGAELVEERPALGTE